MILKAELETYKKKFEQLSDIHRKCRSQKEKASGAIPTSTDDEDDEVTFTMLWLCMYVCSYMIRCVMKSIVVMY